MFDSNQFFGGEKGFYPHEREQSLRFNDNDSAYLSWTPASAGNSKTWTWSGWVKRGNLGGSDYLFHSGDLSVVGTAIQFNTANQIEIYYYSSAFIWRFVTTQVFRDPSAWYHFCVVYDSGNSTASNRMRLYVNGNRVTSFGTSSTITLNQNTSINSNSYTHYISTPSNYLDGYLSEVHFVDGTALDADSFGETKSGVWIPKAYTGSYGTNGFYLPLDADANDDSGNGNNWTENNLAATDYVLDSPTNNFATLNVLDQYAGNANFQEGNLKVAPAGDNDWDNWQATIPVSSGKWYAEFLIGSNTLHIVGINDATTRFDSHVGDAAGSYGYYGDSGNKYNNGTGSAYGATFTTGDIIGVALDLDAGTLVFYKNNSSQGTAFTGISGEFVFAGSSKNSGEFEVLNFGQDSSFAGNKTAQGNTDANGIGDFYYTPPSGYLALCTSNLPEPAFSPADDASPQDHFNTVLYSGNNNTGPQSVTGVGFQPDFTWLKERITVNQHYLVDAVRGDNSGVMRTLFSSQTSAEQSLTTDTDLTYGIISSLDSDGFTVDAGSANSGATNYVGRTYVAWNWKANGAGVSNTDGSITSTVSANTEAGFSIVSWTGSGSGSTTVGHGLDSAPDFWLLKNRSASESWGVGFTALGGANDYMYLNSTSAKASSSNIWSGAPTSEVVNVGSIFNGSNDYIAYCFHSVEGFSKFGSYTGNGSSDGPFVYTGFRPAYVMIKRTDVAENWGIVDTSRSLDINPMDDYLIANGSDTEVNASAAIEFDFLSNGFKAREDGAIFNASGGTYIYMAFAENPFKYTTAR